MNNLLQSSDYLEIPAEEIKTGLSEPKPQISILMLAYNHEPFISTAIESVISQQSDLPFELIIGEDNSSDKTSAVCREWQSQYPQIIRIISAPVNVGMHRNFARLWHHSRAPLIAFCEGDDYWTDSNKLQRQLDWFACRPDGVLCGSDCERLVQTDSGAWKPAGLAMHAIQKETYSIEDLIRHYTFHFSTVMVRKDRVQFPRWFWDSYCVDRPLYLLAAENGEVGHIGGVTSRYREHEGGAWSPKSASHKAASSRALFAQLEQHFAPEYGETLRDALAGILWSYMSAALEAGDVAAARTLFWQLLGQGLPRSIRKRPTALPTVFVRTHLPRLYRALKPVA